MNISPFISIGEASQIVAGIGFPELLQGKKDGPYPFYKVGDISENWRNGNTYITTANHYLDDSGLNTLKAKLIPADSIIFAKIGAAIGLNRRAITSQPSLVDNNVFALVPDQQKAAPRYLFHFMCSVELMPLARATTVPSLRKGDISALLLQLPSLPTQHRIVAEIEEKLSRLDAAQSALLRAQANLKRYRDLTVLEAVTGGRESLNKAWNPDDSPALPKGWRWTPIATIASLTGGLAKSANRKTVAPRRLVPYLRVANVQRGYLDLKEIKEIEATEAEIKDLQLEQDDVLFNEGGDRDKLGRGWLWESQIPEAIHQNHVFRARADRKQVLPLFLSYCGNSYGAAWFWHHGKQTTNLASISLKVLRAFPISLPPLKIQQQIVTELERRLSVIDRTEITLRTQLERAKRLRQSILQQAFSPTRQDA